MKLFALDTGVMSSYFRLVMLSCEHVRLPCQYTARQTSSKCALVRSWASALDTNGVCNRPHSRSKRLFQSRSLTDLQMFPLRRTTSRIAEDYHHLGEMVFGREQEYRLLVTILMVFSGSVCSFLPKIIVLQTRSASLVKISNWARMIGSRKTWLRIELRSERGLHLDVIQILIFKRKKS